MLLKDCTQYVSKFGKLSSGHRTGLGFIPIPKKGNAKECSNYLPLCSLYMLVRLCSKSFKLGLNSMWIMNFQMCKLGLKNIEGPESKLSTFTGSLRKQRNSRKTSTSASFTKDFMWITTNCRKVLEMGMPDHITCLLRNLYAGQEVTIRTGHGTTKWFKIGKGIQ